MKKIFAAVLILSLLAAVAMTGCNDTEDGKVSDRSTEGISGTASSTRNAVEQLVTDAATAVSEAGSAAESKAEEMATDAESAVSDLFNETNVTNVNN